MYSASNCWPRKPLKFFRQLLVFLRWSLGLAGADLLGDGLEPLVGHLLMVRHHFLRELLHVVALRSLLCQLTELNLGGVALESFRHKRLITEVLALLRGPGSRTRRHLARRLLAGHAGLLATASRRHLGHQRGADQQRRHGNTARFVSSFLVSEIIRFPSSTQSLTQSLPGTLNKEPRIHDIRLGRCPFR